jgi:hypothetical protein
VTVWIAAIAAAVVLAIVLAIFRRPWEKAQAQAVRIAAAMSPRRREELTRAVDRIAAELAAHRNQEDGNPDDELFDEFYRWFGGVEGIDVAEIYTRKQERDRRKASRS